MGRCGMYVTVFQYLQVEDQKKSATTGHRRRKSGRGVVRSTSGSVNDK